ncbi:ABC transporter permease [bacterium]|nr:ABC transporter permease [bacterium]
MNITQGFSVGLSAIHKNKLRSFLTMLGIVIGIATVIGMVSIGDGAKRLVLAEFQKIGAANTVIVFRPGRIEKDGKRVRNTSPEYLEYEDALKILASCPSVESVSPEILQIELPASYRGNTKEIKVSAGIPGYARAHNWDVESGRFLQQADIDEAALVCVIGTEIRRDLYGNLDPIGRELMIRNTRFTVIGVMEEKGDARIMEGWDNSAVMPLTTMQKRFMGNDIVWVIFSEAKSFELIDQALAEIKLVLMRRHGNVDEIFEFQTVKDILESVGRVSMILKVLLGGIASIALFVGGIGIMNIMLVSVTERTREIGLRKAVGAKRMDILFQFLVESIVMSLVGGTIGIMVGAFIGMGAAAAITTFLIKDIDWPAVVSVTAAIAAVSTSAFIGICSGIYPAYKAATLMPTEALRHE